MKAKGLGRGLGALIEEADENTYTPLEIDVQAIDVCKAQPRKHFDEEKLRELADSIAQHGVIQPLILRKQGDRYLIVAGERRFRAARLAGLKQVPAVLKDIDEKEVLEISIIENIQREDLNPMEEAEAVALLMEDYGLTQEGVAQRLGRSRSAVANTLRLLTLPKKVRDYVESGQLSPGHARALLGLQDEQAIASAAEVVIRTQASVRETEKLVKRLQEPKKPPKEKASRRNPDFAAAEKTLCEALETKVTIQGGPERGKLVVEYYTKEQLEGLYEFLTSHK